MITPNINHCPDCPDIPDLINAINCKIYEQSLKTFNNIIFGTNCKADRDDIMTLLTYRDILTKKHADSDYATTCEFGIKEIASRVRVLTAGCVKCIIEEILYIFHPTTTTTSTTAAPVIAYVYNMTTYSCGDCPGTTGTGSVANILPLEVGKFYYQNFVGDDVIVHIDEFVEQIELDIPLAIDPATVADTCAEVVCPTTTTTTTTGAQTFVYNATALRCGTCDNATGLSLSNNLAATLGMFYYSPIEGRVIRIDSVLGIDPGEGPVGLDLLTESATCAGVVCPTTTTTSTTAAPTTTTTTTAALLSFEYRISFRVCGSCASTPISVIVINDVAVNVGSYFFSPRLNSIVRVEEFVGFNLEEPGVDNFDLGTESSNCFNINCTVFTYTATIFNCGTCTVLESGVEIESNQLLTIGAFYPSLIDTSYSVRIDSLLSTSIGAVIPVINPFAPSATCADTDCDPI